MSGSAVLFWKVEKDLHSFYKFALWKVWLWSNFCSDDEIDYSHDPLVYIYNYVVKRNDKLSLVQLISGCSTPLTSDTGKF